MASNFGPIMNFGPVMNFAPPARGRPAGPMCLRTPSRTPSPMSMPLDCLPQGKAEAQQEEAGPSTPRSKGFFSSMPGMDDVKGQEPGPAAPWTRLVFCEEERGLPSLPRGWRTPDPSPTRSGLPKCAAYTEKLVAEIREKSQDRAPAVPCQAPINQTPSTEKAPEPLAPEFGLFTCQPCGRQAWADMEDDAEHEEEPSGSALSRGSAGHPYTCGEACKYAKKARGCKDGANCDHCHLCEWKKSDAKKKTRGGRRS